MHNNMNVNVSGPVQAPAMQSYQTIVLKYNIVDGHNLLTQEMMSQENTIYVIKWDFELAEDITIPANCVLQFEGGSISGSTIILSNDCSVIGNNTSITSNTLPLIYANGKHNIKICGINFSGNVQSLEDIIDYSLTDERQSAIQFESCFDVQIENCSAIKTQNLVLCDECSNIYVNNCYFEGVLGTDMSIGGGSGSGGVNYHYAIQGQMDDSVIDNVRAIYGGGCILLQQSTKKCKISNCSAKYSHDNGYYLSSAYNSSIVSCTAEISYGDGIKIRGSYNSAESCKIINTVVNFGIAITSVAGVTISSPYGDVGGVGNSVINCCIEEAEGGIRIEAIEDGLNVADTKIIGNYIKSISNSRYAIRDASFGCCMMDNYLECTKNINVVAIGLSDVLCKKTVFANNFIKGVSTYGLKITQLEEGFISNNYYKGVTRCIGFNDTSKTFFSNNISSDATLKYYYVSGTLDKNVFSDINNSDNLINFNHLGANADNNIFTNIIEQSGYNRIGVTANRPTKRLKAGIPFYDQTINTQLHYDGLNWVEFDKEIAGIKRIGTTQERPNMPNEGFSYFDETIGKKITFHKKISETLIPYTAISPNNELFVSNTLTNGETYAAKNKNKNAVTVGFSKVAANPTEDDLLILYVSGNINTYFYFNAPDPTVYPYIYALNNATANAGYEIFSVNKWQEEDGAVAGVARSGNTASRPIGSSIYVGFKYQDTTLGKPIFANAISGDTVTWVDATGATV